VKLGRLRAASPSIYNWLTNTLRSLSKKSELAVAIRYLLSRWAALTRYVDDDRIEIDNSTAECALRGVALGRRFFVAGSDVGVPKLRRLQINGLASFAHRRNKRS